MIQTTTFAITSETEKAWRVRPRVSPRVAMEAPRMFSSFSRVVRELFQNAYRAGATRVDVRWNSASAILEIQDDGAGMDDPQILLDAGASGWDQAQIIEPAGLGFFALFNPAYVEWIEVTSRGAGNWRMRLTPDNIRRAVQDENAWIHVEPISETNDAHGLLVRLCVTERERRQVNRDLLVEARAQYPYAVQYTEDGKTIEVRPRTFSSDMNEIETTVGRVEWEIPYGTGYHRGRACWEYVPFISNHLTAALGEAAQNHPQTALAEIAANSLMIWHIEPACGVRPQLPERSELIQDDALRMAANVIVTSIVDDMLARAREDFRDAPARVESAQCVREPYGKWLERGKFTQVLLKCLDYALVEKFSGEVWIETVDEDSWHPHLEATLIYSRTAQIIGNEHLAATLNFLGHEVAFEHDAPILEIRVSGLCADFEKCPYVAFAERIEIEGIGDVPFLIRERNDKNGSWTYITYVGNAEDCIHWFYHTAWSIGYLFVANDNYEWASRDGDDVTFEREQALEEVTSSIARTWAFDLAEAMQECYDMQRALARLQDAENNLESAGRWLQKHSGSTFKPFHQSVKGMRARAQYTRARMQETLAQITPSAMRDESAK
ncbi:hypothetical protein FBQ82_01200 [Anaerolineae bacterium CFX7]|nr:hypothetical protein [Anaerolineae bacterium CFX7]